MEEQVTMVMAKDTRKLQVTTCPTYSDFFEHFCKGLHKHMGDIMRPDRALAHDIIKEIMNLLDQEWETGQLDQCLELSLEGVYYVLGFTLALLGEELSLVELCSISNYWTQAVQHTKPHIVITLLERFKNEVGGSYHLMPVLFMTPRGLEPRKWVHRVLEEYRRRNIQLGYMFRNQDGTKMKNKIIESKLHDILEAVRVLKPNLIA